MDKIILTDLKISTIIGTRPEERTRRQELRCSIELDCDLRIPGHSDKLEHSIDYTELERGIVQLCGQSQFFLLEKLAESIAAQCLNIPGALAITVKIEKFGVLQYGKTVAIQINRTK
jgi:FolB domain-containing protein